MGLIYFPDQPAAVTAMVDALRPGGRIAAITYSTPDRNGFFSVPVSPRRLRRRRRPRSRPSEPALGLLRPSQQKALGAYADVVDERRFVESLMAAVPEAFADRDDREHYLGDEPLAYPALGDARIWLEDHALEISGVVRPHAEVKAEHADAFARFWGFVESQAQAARDDAALRTLLQVECFEGVGWVADVTPYLGPETRALLVDAEEWLARYNRQVGRWAPLRFPK